MELDIQVVEVSFRGNTEKKYDFLTDNVAKVNDYVMVDTANGPSIGKIVGVKSFSKRSKLCNKWVIFTLGSKIIDAFREMHAEMLADAEVKEMLGD